jgi:hypothetical protein
VTRRFVPINTVEMNPTLVIEGRPVGIPEFWIQITPAMTISGSAVPVAVAPTHSSSTGSSAGLRTPDWVWYASDLTAPTDSDGYNLSEWPEHNGGPSWESADGYRPNVRKRRLLRHNGEYVTWDKTVYFEHQAVNHMWIDLGETLDQPFTVIMVGIIHTYPTATYGHYLLDAGKSHSHLTTDRDHNINDHTDYRSVMLFQRSSALLATNTSSDLTYGKHVRSKHNSRHAPRMFFGVFNGDHSRVGAFDVQHRFFGRGKVDGKHPRYLVMGRRTNRLSDNLASHMTIVEVQIHKDSMTKKTLVKHYKQLSGKYHFNQIRIP